MPKPHSPAQKRLFAPRFRRQAFGWRSQPGVQRVREATAEFQKVAKKDPALAAAGATLFLEKVSPALEQVDSSWMDRLIGTVERVWSASRKPGGHVQGTLVRAVRDFASTNLRFAVWARCTLQCYRLINDK